MTTYENNLLFNDCQQVLDHHKQFPQIYNLNLFKDAFQLILNSKYIFHRTHTVKYVYYNDPMPESLLLEDFSLYKAENIGFCIKSFTRWQWDYQDIDIQVHLMKPIISLNLEILTIDKAILDNPKIKNFILSNNCYIKNNPDFIKNYYIL